MWYCQSIYAMDVTFFTREGVTWSKQLLYLNNFCNEVLQMCVGWNTERSFKRISSK